MWKDNIRHTLFFKAEHFFYIVLKKRGGGSRGSTCTPQLQCDQKVQEMRSLFMLTVILYTPLTSVCMWDLNGIWKTTHKLWFDLTVKAGEQNPSAVATVQSPYRAGYAWDKPKLEKADFLLLCFFLRMIEETLLSAWHHYSYQVGPLLLGLKSALFEPFYVMALGLETLCHFYSTRLDPSSSFRVNLAMNF